MSTCHAGANFRFCVVLVFVPRGTKTDGRTDGRMDVAAAAAISFFLCHPFLDTFKNSLSTLFSLSIFPFRAISKFSL